MAQGPLPENRRDLAQILKNNEFNILVAADEIVSILNLDEERYESVTFLLRKIQNNIRKSKKFVDQLNNEWWNSAIPWEPKSTKTPSNSSTLVSLDPNIRKNLFSIRLQQQRVRLSSILELIRETAIIEGYSPIEIAALALQLLANEVDNRKVAKVAKEIISSGGFSGLSLIYVPVEKALFLLDLLEIGGRKYTQLRQTLLPENIHFPPHSKVMDLRNVLVSRNLIQLYPNPQQPIGVHTPYSVQVHQTLERILTTLNPLNNEEFPLTFRIADGLDGSGCNNIYNHSNSNTKTNNFILFCFKPISICTASNKIVWQNNSPNSPFSQQPVFLCAAKECEKNIRLFMEQLINPESAKFGNGISIENGIVKVEIIRSMFDGKWLRYYLVQEVQVAKCALLFTTI